MVVDYRLLAKPPFSRRSLRPHTFRCIRLSPGNTGASEVTGSLRAPEGRSPFANAGNNPTVASNTAILTYPAATASWGTITHFGIWDALTSGNYRPVQAR